MEMFKKSVAAISESQRQSHLVTLDSNPEFYLPKQKGSAIFQNFLPRKVEVDLQ